MNRLIKSTDSSKPDQRKKNVTNYQFQTQAINLKLTEILTIQENVEKDKGEI